MSPPRTDEPILSNLTGERRFPALGSSCFSAPGCSVALVQCGSDMPLGETPKTRKSMQFLIRAEKIGFLGFLGSFSGFFSGFSGRSAPMDPKIHPIFARTPPA